MRGSRDLGNAGLHFRHKFSFLNAPLEGFFCIVAKTFRLLASLGHFPKYSVRSASVS